ncbi:MAG: hypothetical protein [Lokiarchaeia virus VerdaV1]|uniref:Uncharacterized protein n=1 Tax=Lokiarchaeia virus VerdaV1 TaxID=3070170 RepID=A0AA35G9V9_9CAUD|nr:MAG: hypothetical protein QIT41_gp27 [Lokiarchaeia virus VerdaV1]BDI54876.1 MAG: hypothetical protein [Lokiarchaeia virus VerdaV1]
MNFIKKLIDNFSKKFPLKIRIFVSWEWNYKSKKKRLKEEIERLKDIIERYEKQVPSAYIQNIPKEAEQ